MTGVEALSAALYDSGPANGTYDEWAATIIQNLPPGWNIVRIDGQHERTCQYKAALKEAVKVIAELNAKIAAERKPGGLA